MEFLNSPLGRPGTDGDNVDWSLMTLKEMHAVYQCEAEHERIVRRRAEELRFYPDTLTENERLATIKCLTYEEMKPAIKGAAKYDRNRRLASVLSFDILSYIS